jgi:hypothetical protein
VCGDDAQAFDGVSDVNLVRVVKSFEAMSTAMTTEDLVDSLLGSNVRIVPSHAAAQLILQQTKDLAISLHDTTMPHGSVPVPSRALMTMTKSRTLRGMVLYGIMAVKYERTHPRITVFLCRC